MMYRRSEKAKDYHLTSSIHLRENEYPYRLKLDNCYHKEAYRYFFEPLLVGQIWLRLCQFYGDQKDNEIRSSTHAKNATIDTVIDQKLVFTNKTFQLIELQSKLFIFRANLSGNPIHVIPKRLCNNSDINHLHRLMNFNLPEQQGKG